MKKPKKGWMTPNAWLLWKMQSWTLEQIKTAFLALVPSISGYRITGIWHSAMIEDGYYSGYVHPGPAYPGNPDDR